jgi:hypothetical protein
MITVSANQMPRFLIDAEHGRVETRTKPGLERLVESGHKPH